jgi:hypothetical protein
MATKKKLVKKGTKINPITGNVWWMDEAELQLHPDHRGYENGGSRSSEYKGSQTQYNGDDELAY